MFNFGGGMLTGAEIEKQIKKGNIVIDPYDENMLNPNSYNLKLHPQLLVYKRGDNFEVPKIISQTNADISADPENIEELSEGTNIVSKRSGISQSYFTTITTDDLQSLSIIKRSQLPPIDMRAVNETIEFEIPETGFLLEPGILYIGRTVETTYTDKYIPMLDGRSSGGRLGISIHICAGFGDIGFEGSWTLEITCVEPVIIYPNVPIAQVSYFKPVGKVRDLYAGRYQGQKDATASRFYKK